MRGLQTIDLRCSAIAAGCLPIREPACDIVGLPINLLLLLTEDGVVITDALISGNGANKLEYRPLRWLISDTLLEAEVRSGVVISEVGWNVAIETLLLG